MRGFEFCLSLSQTRSSNLRVSFSFFDLALLLRNLSFIAFLSSVQIKLGFLCFLPQSSWLKNYFYFLTNFIDISLCAEAPFSILKKASAPITSGECSRGC